MRRCSHPSLTIAQHSRVYTFQGGGIHRGGDNLNKACKCSTGETHIRELQSSINMIKIFVLLTIMDITQSVDPRNNIFLELMNMSRNALFAGKNVCMPHAPSVGAGIPWVAHPISKCDTCTLFDHHTSGLYNSIFHINVTNNIFLPHHLTKIHIGSQLLQTLNN